MARLGGLLLFHIFLGFFLSELVAQERIAHPFYRLDLPNNFPDAHINTIERDQNGLLWLGTNNGLCRYISTKEVKIYNSAQVEELKSDLINVLLCDRKGNLWIGTRQGGLTKYDPRKDKWTNYMNSPGDNTSLRSNDVLCLEEDQKGQIWVGTEEGLSIYQEERDNFLGFFHNPNDSSSLSANAVLSITEDRKGRIWLGTWAGAVNVFVPNLGDQSKSTFKRIPLKKPGGGQESVWNIFQDSEERYWIGTHFTGLYLMQLPPNSSANPDEWSASPQFHNYPADPNDATSLSNQVIIGGIDQDSKGNVWIGTTYGLCEIPVDQLPDASLFNAPTEEKPKIKFRQHLNDPLNVRTVGSDNIVCIYVDSQDLVWLGTDQGVTQYNWYAKQTKSYVILSDKYPNVRVNGIFIPKQEKDGAILSLVTGEVIYYNLKTGKSSPLHEVYGFVEPINDAVQLSEFEEGILSVTRLTGITHIDFQQETRSLFSFPSQLKDWLKVQGYKWIHHTQDRDGKERLWIGGDEGIWLIEDGGDRLRKFTHSEDPGSISQNEITGIVQDASGRIWISTYHGLNLVCEEEDSVYFKRFLHDMGDPTSLPNNRLLAITFAKDKLILGTQGGLYGYDLIDQTFYTLGKDEISHTIISLIAVDSLNVWASTQEGILNYHIPSGNVFEFKEMEIGFVAGAMQSDQNGAIYVGGLRGFVRFEPEQIVKNNSAPKVTITEVQTLSPKVSRTLGTMSMDTVTLGHDNYQLSISFSSSNFNRPEDNKYAYRMLGFDDNWVYSNFNQPVIYTNLKHGRYQFEVKGCNNDGIWSVEPEVLHIIVEPAFWETSLFQVLAFILVIGLIYSFTKFYTRNVRDQNQKLLAEISMREQFEKELKSANAELEKSNQELEQFAFIASHDLKEPLQTIDSFTSLLRRKNAKDQLGEHGVKYIEFIGQGSTRMMEIIKSLLSYSTTRQEELNVQYSDFKELVQDTLSDLSEFIKERKALIEVQPLPSGYCDPVQIRMVFSNLIMNGIKFNTHPNPRVQVRGKKLSNGNIEFAVQDNGIGIEEAFHEKVFGIFKRLHNRDKFEGSGIGLALCSKIIERHKGKIWIESKPGEGSTFRFEIGNLSPNEQKLASTYEVVSSQG